MITGDLLLGVDVGTQATKAVLLDVSGEQLATAQSEYRVDLPKPLWAEQWPCVWLDACVEVIREVIGSVEARGRRVAGLCVSSLYGGSGIPLDRDLAPVRPCLIWMDRRATQQAEWVKENIDTEELFSITGNWVDSYFGYTKILWLRENEPENWERTALFLPPHSYIVFRLTGSVLMDHSSAGNLSGIYDIHSRAWSADAANLLGIPLDLMPEQLACSDEIVGEIHEAGSKLTGLPVGTPVLAGGVDAPMATLGAGAMDAGNAVVMMGSSTCWGIVHEGETYSPDLVSMPHVENGLRKVYTWAGSATSGAAVNWARHTLVQPGEALGAVRRGIPTFKELDDAARLVTPGCEGLVVLPYLMGERAPVWDPAARGAIFGLTLAHTSAHIYRAFLEGVGYALRHAMDVGQAAGLPKSESVTVVGGVTRSPVWLQILADITGRPLRTLKTQGIGAPLGDAFLVGKSLGMLDREVGIAKWLSFSDPIRPELGHRRIYDECYRTFRQLYEETRPLLGP